MKCESSDERNKLVVVMWVSKSCLPLPAKVAFGDQATKRMKMDQHIGVLGTSRQFQQAS